jgi:hypothetical protein
MKNGIVRLAGVSSIDWLGLNAIIEHDNQTLRELVPQLRVRSSGRAQTAIAVLPQ